MSTFTTTIDFRTWYNQGEVYQKKPIIQKTKLFPMDWYVKSRIPDVSE